MNVWFELPHTSSDDDWKSDQWPAITLETERTTTATTTTIG